MYRYRCQVTASLGIAEKLDPSFSSAHWKAGLCLGMMDHHVSYLVMYVRYVCALPSIREDASSNSWLKTQIKRLCSLRGLSESMTLADPCSSLANQFHKNGVSVVTRFLESQKLGISSSYERNSSSVRVVSRSNPFAHAYLDRTLRYFFFATLRDTDKVHGVVAILLHRTLARHIFSPHLPDT